MPVAQVKRGPALLAELAPPFRRIMPIFYRPCLWPQTVTEASEQAESLGLGADGARALLLPPAAGRG